MTTTVDRDLARRLRAPAYAVLAVTLLFQISDYVSGQLPLRPGAAAWRFAAIGSASNIFGNVLLLLLLVYAVALFAGDRPIMWFVGTAAILLAALLLGGAALFALDRSQVRSNVPVVALAKFDFAMAQSLAKLFVEGIVASLFAVSAFRASAAAKRIETRHAHAADTPPLLRPPPLRAH